MTFALCFWILMLLWLILNFAPNFKYTGVCEKLILFLLLLLLGWQLFGKPIHQ